MIPRSNRPTRRREGIWRKVVAGAGVALALSGTGAWADEATPAAPVTATAVEELTLDELMKVRVTTVSRSESTVGQSPAAVFVITQQMIQRSGATEIPELFRMVPGMDVARIDSHTWAISIRGFNATVVNKLLVQMDGRTLYNPFYSGTYWDSVDYPLEDIERIEIIRGPGGSVWGANAVNGIINIITKSAKETQGGSIDLAVGNVDHVSSTARYGFEKDGDRYFRVYARGFQKNGLHSVGGDQHDDWRGARTGFRYDRTPADATNFTLQGDWYSSTLGQSNKITNVNNPPSFATINTADTKSEGGNIIARWTHQNSKDSNWTLQAYYDQTDSDREDGYAGEKVHTANIDFQQQLVRGRHQFVFGAGYLLQKIKFHGSKFDNGFVVSPLSLKGNRNVASAFVQDEIKLRQNLTLTLGSKLEHNYYTGLEYEPSARLLYSPSQKSSAWMSVSRAVRTPSLFETGVTVGLGAAALAPGAVLVLQSTANPNLASERVLAYEAGYRTQANKKVALDAALFYNQYSDLVELRGGTPTIVPFPGGVLALVPAMWVNGESARSYGFELATTWDAKPNWKMHGAYTYFNLNLSPAPGDLGTITNSNPRHQVYLRSSHELSADKHFDLIGRYVARLPGNMVPSYFALDAQLLWKKSDKLEFALVGQNLLDSHHQEFNGVLFPVEAKRSLYAKVTRRW